MVGITSNINHRESRVAALKQVAANRICISSNKARALRHNFSINTVKYTLGLQSRHYETIKKALATFTSYEQVVSSVESLPKETRPRLRFKHKGSYSGRFLRVTSCLILDCLLIAVLISIARAGISLETTGTKTDATVIHVEHLRGEPNNGQPTETDTIQRSNHEYHHPPAGSRQLPRKHDLAGEGFHRTPANNRELREKDGGKFSEREESSAREWTNEPLEGNLQRRSINLQQSRGRHEAQVLSRTTNDETISSTEHVRTTKIDRSKRSNNLPNPIKHVCGDCLAIPMVALVGRRQVNGFIIRPAPSNLHSKLPESSLAPQHEQSHRVRNNDNDVNNNHDSINGQMDQIDHQEPPDGSSRSVTVQQRQQQLRRPHNKLKPDKPKQPPQSFEQPHIHVVRNGEASFPPAGTDAGYKTHAADYYPQRAYDPPAPGSHPFEPVSDEKCPMVGPLTVCDQIGSYPADAILHKLDNLKRALRMSYFNIESLFSDESAGLSDPFEGPAPLKRPPSDDNRANQTNLTSNRPDDSVKTNYKYQQSPYRSESNNNPKNTSTETSSGFSQARLAASKESLEGSYDFEDDSQWRQAQNARKKRLEVSPISTQEATSGGISFVPGMRQDSGSKGQISTDGSPLEDSLTPNDKFLYLVERQGLNGISGTLHNVRPAQQIMEKLGGGSAHKIDATNFSESGHDIANYDDTSNHDDADRYDTVPNHQLEATHRTSEPSVRSGHRGGGDGDGAFATGKRQLRRRAVTTPSETLKRGRKPDAGARVPSFALSLGSPELRPHMSTDGWELDHGLVDGGYDGGGGGSLPGVLTLLEQTSARHASEVAKNNQEQQRRLHPRQLDIVVPSAGQHRVKRTVSLSWSSPLAFSRGVEVSGGSARTTKALTTSELSSAVSSGRVERPNLLSTAAPSSSRPVSGLAPSDYAAGRFAADPMNSKTKLALADGEFVEKRSIQAHAPSGRDTRKAVCQGANTTRGYPSVSTSERLTVLALERSRRQVPISVEPSGRLNAPPNAATAEEESESPSADSDADQGAAPQPICRAKSIYISPRAALNDKKQWKYVVNAPERDPRIKQIIRVDVCDKQKYAKKKLLALDSESGLLEVDTFFIPSCCVCQLIADRRLGDGESPVSSMDETA